MLKKIISILMIVCFVNLSACVGTLFKRNQIYKVHSKKLDWFIVAVDSFFLLFFIIPGIVALAVDYSTGTLYLPNETIVLKSVDANEIYTILKEKNINVEIKDIEESIKQYNNKVNSIWFCILFLYMFYGYLKKILNINWKAIYYAF